MFQRITPAVVLRIDRREVQIQGVQLGGFCTMFSASWLIRGYCKKRDFCPFCLPHPFRLKRVSNRKVRVVADGGLSIGKWARVGGNFSCLLHPSFPILGKCAGRDRHCWMDICRSLYGNFPGTKVLSIYFSFIFSSIRQIFMQSSCSLR